MRIAPVHIGLTVVIGIDGGVDVVPVFLLPDQWLAEGILERTVGRVGHQDTDAVTVQRGIKVVLTIALDSLDGPGAVLA